MIKHIFLKMYYIRFSNMFRVCLSRAALPPNRGLILNRDHNHISVYQLMTRISALSPSQALASTRFEGPASSSAQKRIPQHLLVAG